MSRRDYLAMLACYGLTAAFPLMVVGAAWWQGWAL